MTTKKLILRSSFAALALLATVSILAPKVFAQTAESVGNAVSTVVDAGASMFVLDFSSGDFQVVPAEQTFQLPAQVLQLPENYSFNITVEENNTEHLQVTDAATGVTVERWVTTDNGIHWEKVSE